MSPSILIAIAAIALLILSSLAGGPANADVHRCPGINPEVMYTGQEDGETACRGAADAIAFLEHQGIAIEKLIKIRMVPKLPKGAAPTALGFYDRHHELAYVLNFLAVRAAIKDNKYFDLSFDQNLHRSIVTHEVAHAISYQNFAMDDPEWVAAEYIAYVTQLATMPEKLQERVLARFAAPGFSSLDEIKNVTILLGPEVFAVKAFRHFSRPENGGAFLQKLLTGGVQLYPNIDP